MACSRCGKKEHNRGMNDLAKSFLIPPEETPPIEGGITHGAFANPLLNEIFKRYGRVVFSRSSACMEFEAFLKRILFRNGGKRLGTCLEIGTYQGITAVVLSQFFDKVICVSIDEDSRRIIKRDIVADLGLQNRIEFHDCVDNSEKHNIVARMQFDFAYLDGDHVHDTDDDFALVKHCGRVLLHEAWPLQSPVWNLVHSLPAAEVTWADYDCFAYWHKAEK